MLTQDGLIAVARRHDLCMFEYLVEHGVLLPPAEDSVAVMLQRRRDWINQAEIGRAHV